MPAQSSGVPNLGCRENKEGGKNRTGQAPTENGIDFINKYQMIFQDQCTGPSNWVIMMISCYNLV